MKIKKLFKYQSKKQIWRLIPTNTQKLVIEERDVEEKQVYFTCLSLIDGKVLMNEFQLEEKFWAGIETVYEDIIYFHLFPKPDMPIHKGIIAVDVNTKSIIWQKNDLVFYSMVENKLLCYKQNFESKYFYSVNPQTGKITEELGSETKNVLSLPENNFSDYLFPERIIQSDLMQKEKYEHLISKVIKGFINLLDYNGYSFLNYHELNKSNNFANKFEIIDSEGKIIFNETLNKNIDKLEPDSYFIKGSCLYLLLEKTGLGVYNLNF